jgi:hypothetical protein
MGFFDEISKGISKGINKGINNSVSQNISDVLSGAVNNVVDSVRDSVKDSLQDSVKDSVKSTEKETTSEEQDVRTYPQKDLDGYFSDILAENFPGLQIQKGIAASALGWADIDMPVKNYDFLLKEKETVKGVIMLTPHNRDNNRAFKNAKVLAAKANVPFLNFYTHYPNEKGYVIERIQSLL